jgi:transposase
LNRKGLELAHPNAAGVDTGSARPYVTVLPDRDDEPVRELASVTAELHRLADGLSACGVDTVAIGSTGVQRIPPFELLDARGFTMLQVNARQVGMVSGCCAAG